MIKLNDKTKDRITAAVKFITSNRLTEAELHAEITGVAIHTIDEFKNELCIIDGENEVIYYRKLNENNYEK